MMPFLVVVLIFSGCSLAPKYVRPDMPVPSAWPEKAAGTGQTEAVTGGPDIAWREFFVDPRLAAVIQLALDNNRDLRIAALNVDKAQAMYQIARAEPVPDLGVMATGDKYRISEKMSGDGNARTVAQYTVQLGTLSWEIDFFGRLRSLKDRALHLYLATGHARSAAQISLVAAVANGYLVLAADRENLKLAQSTLVTQQDFYDLILKSRDLGMTSDLDLRQAQSQVEAARVDLARYSGLVATDENLLHLLVGSPIPQDLLPEGLSSVTEMAGLSPGLPSDVLLRRPDILMTEFQLQAANANIGVARAAFFPRITLTAGGGSMSPELTGLFGAGTGTWTFNSTLITPIFAGNSLRNNLKAARIDRDIAVAGYEKAIQTAFREVSDALTSRKTLVEQTQAQQSLVKALDESYRLSEARYKAGIDGYLGVLVAQRALYAARQGLVQVRLAGQINHVTLYKALGGGADR